MKSIRRSRRDGEQIFSGKRRGGVLCDTQIPIDAFDTDFQNYFQPLSTLFSALVRLDYAVFTPF